MSFRWMVGNTHSQILGTSTCTQLLAPNGSSWDPAQARRFGMKTLCQFWVYLPPWGKGKSATIYLCFQQQQFLLCLGMWMMLPVRLPSVLVAADGAMILASLTCIWNNLHQLPHDRRRRKRAHLLSFAPGLKDHPLQRLLVHEQFLSCLAEPSSDLQHHHQSLLADRYTLAISESLSGMMG